MATLLIAATTDFRPDPPETDIDRLRFSGGTGETVTASFEPAQFSTGFIASSLRVIGADSADEVRIVSPSDGTQAERDFSAAAWTFDQWSSDDRITLIGTDSGEILTGSARADSISGSGGDDSLGGGGGHDTLDGGSGRDTLDGGAGADEMRGGDGADVYFVNSPGDIVAEDSSTDLDIVRSSVDFTLGAHVERLILVGNADRGFGNDGDNQIFGSAVSSVLNGMGGHDLVDGGMSADTLRGGDGNDTVRGGAGNDRIIGDDGADVLRGQGGDDSLYGGAGSDTLVPSFDGATLAVGGPGNDTYLIDPSGGPLTIVEEAAGAGIDTVVSAVSVVLDHLGANVEDVELTGAADADANGNGLDNRIVGNDGSNRLTGGTGADTLTGGAGADTLAGGKGNDLLAGGGEEDIYVFADTRAGRDTIIGFAAAEDRFDLSGGSFTAMSDDGSSTTLQHDGGTIVVQGVSGLDLGDWNALVHNGSGARIAGAGVASVRPTAVAVWEQAASHPAVLAVDHGAFGHLDFAFA